MKSYVTKAEKYEKDWKEYLDHTYTKFLDKIDITKRDIILDTSSGTGLFAKHLLEQEFKELVLNDPDDELQRLSKERFQANNKIRHTTSTIEDVESINNYFTKILSLNAWHRYEDKDKAVQKMKTILKPDGEIHILDWNREGLFKFIHPFISLYERKTIQADTVKDAKKRLENHGLNVVDTETWTWKYWNFYYMKAK